MLSDMKPSCLADLQEDSRCPPPSMVSQSMILSQPHTPLVPQTYFNLSAPPSTEILERSHPARKRQVLILNNTKDQNIATDWIHNLYTYSTGISDSTNTAPTVVQTWPWSRHAPRILYCMLLKGTVLCNVLLLDCAAFCLNTNANTYELEDECEMRAWESKVGRRKYP